MEHDDILKYLQKMIFEELKPSLICESNIEKLKKYDYSVKINLYRVENMGRRYEGLFIVPGMCDGVYDTYNDPNYDNELSFEEMIDIMNDTWNQTEVWKKKYDEMKLENKNLKKLLIKNGIEL